jgi:uncharacterized protein
MGPLSLFIILAIAALILSAWAHLANERPHLTRTLHILFGLVAGLFAVLGVFFVFVAPFMADDPSDAPGTRWVGVFFIGLALAVGLPMLRPVRVAFTRITRIDPDSMSDMVGMIVIAAAIVLMIGTNQLDPGETNAVSEIDLIAQALTFLLIAYFAIGGSITRSFSSAWGRLGLVRPTSRQVALSLLLVLPIFAVSIVSALLTQQLQPEYFEEIGERTDAITQDMAHLRGATMIGVTAGVGEETLFRGAMQPRFGILLTSVLFTLIHVQYGYSFMLLGVFFTSVLLGLQRRWMNTTACIITHAAYNFSVVMISTIPVEAAFGV